MNGTAPLAIGNCHDRRPRPLASPVDFGNGLGVTLAGGVLMATAYWYCGLHLWRHLPTIETLRCSAGEDDDSSKQPMALLPSPSS